MKPSQLIQALDDARRWMNELAENGGPDVTINAHKKAAHEALELADHPCPEEAADVIICIVGTAMHHGWSLEEVMQAVVDKVAINRRRTWSKQPDGTWQHI